MHNLPIYQVDAFTDALFGGNPAAVVPLPDFLPEELMQRIAAENNLSETAFVTIRGRGKFSIRWFTPTQEVRLCGHATLAAAHVLYRSGGEKLRRMRFRTQRAGTVTVDVTEEGRYEMTFAADPPQQARSSKKIRAALGGPKPREVYRGTDDVLVVLKNQHQVETLQPNLHVVAELKHRGLLVTAPADEAGLDFVSRGFYPAFGIDEDPVTGSAHTLLTPYWTERLGKKHLVARQGGARRGTLHCRMRGKKKVVVAGHGVTYLTGQLLLDKL